MLIYTKGNYLPKYPVLDLIGKNFRFLDTQLLKIYKILENSYNWQVLQSCSKFYQKLVNLYPKFVRKVKILVKHVFKTTVIDLPIFGKFIGNLVNLSKFY